jgi:hypothetical protein
MAFGEQAHGFVYFTKQAYNGGFTRAGVAGKNAVKANLPISVNPFSMRSLLNFRYSIFSVMLFFTLVIPTSLANSSLAASSVASCSSTRFF